MVEATHNSFNASDRSLFSIIKREIHFKALDAGFSAQQVGKLDIIISEMTSNLHKYAKGGEMLMGILKDGDNEYIELICLDEGPGMYDPLRMLADGFSSTNTMGHGLGSMKRLSDYFDIYSAKGWGTVVLSRLYKNPLPHYQSSNTGVEIRPIVVAKTGEKISGDGHYYKQNDQYVKLLVADGLGHGPEANLAVNEAVRAFRQCAYNSPVEIIRDMHASIRKTRGIVGTVVVFDLVHKKFSIAGVGNIATKLLTHGLTKSQLPYNGIIGHNIPNTMNDQELTFSEYQQIVLCSDGIKSRWDIGKYLGINRCDLSIIAAAIYKDYARKTDDMSVIITKIK
ncbi:MAG: ATP-binding SpoIIE family protein phosphatase [Bacteroidota bacterium]